jgi:hypothetical protein
MKLSYVTDAGIVVLLYKTENICYTITHGIRCGIQKARN